ncbi:MAG: hypothetical protein WCE68_02965 [Anaerolineales bacterium]
MKKHFAKEILIGICIIVLTVMSCSIGAINITVGGTATPTAASLPPTSVATATAAATGAVSTIASPTTASTEMLATGTPAASATPTGVWITAIEKGSIGILRGTSLAYDTLGYLKYKQTSKAIARNSDGSWLYIPVPDYPSVLGWAWDGSKYSMVTGNIKSLPVQTVDPAVPAFIRNCTKDLMLVTPGSVLVQPNSEAQFNPGIYTVSDQGGMATPGTGTPTPTPESIRVSSVTLKEGDTADITKDGMNNTYTCP